MALFQTSVTFERNEIRQKKLNEIDTSREDLAIFFRAFLTYTSPFKFLN